MSFDRSDDGDVGAVWKSGDGDREVVESIDICNNVSEKFVCV
jgi:hypothetical protein